MVTCPESIEGSEPAEDLGDVGYLLLSFIS